ncbi:MAG: hypothetical protein KAY24_08840 [Candidatus Eisenbacteria sp.]|nr:hypothetical protein [Candidatus Eisenbacteria bacterium]
MGAKAGCFAGGDFFCMGINIKGFATTGGAARYRGTGLCRVRFLWMEFGVGRFSRSRFS